MDGANRSRSIHRSGPHNWRPCPPEASVRQVDGESAGPNVARQLNGQEQDCFPVHLSKSSENRLTLWALRPRHGNRRRATARLDGSTAYESDRGWCCQPGHRARALRMLSFEPFPVTPRDAFRRAHFVGQASRDHPMSGLSPASASHSQDAAWLRGRADSGNPEERALWLRGRSLSATLPTSVAFKPLRPCVTGARS